MMFFEVNGLDFSYNSRQVLDDVSFSVKAEDVVSILGPNGVGKTTLIKCINRVLKPDAGSVFIEGSDLHRMSGKDIAKNIGYVAQRSETSRTTVFDSVLLGRKPHFEWNVIEKDIRLAGRVLHLLGLDGLALKYVDEVSVGEYIGNLSIFIAKKNRASSFLKSRIVSYSLHLCWIRSKIRLQKNLQPVEEVYPSYCLSLELPFYA